MPYRAFQFETHDVFPRDFVDEETLKLCSLRFDCKPLESSTWVQRKFESLGRFPAKKAVPLFTLKIELKWAVWPDNLVNLSRFSTGSAGEKWPDSRWFWAKFGKNRGFLGVFGPKQPPIQLNFCIYKL